MIEYIQCAGIRTGVWEAVLCAGDAVIANYVRHFPPITFQAQAQNYHKTHHHKKKHCYL